MNEITHDLFLSERVVLTPVEFAATFGRLYTWAYRQIYAGKVKVFSKIGRLMIPESEVHRLVADQTTFKKRSATAEEIEVQSRLPHRRFDVSGVGGVTDEISHFER